MTDPKPSSGNGRLERTFESALFQSRWLIAPFYLGLAVTLGALVVIFAREAWHDLSQLFSMTTQEGIMMALNLIDISLIANLLLIVIFSGYENFVSKIDTAGHEDRPDWMGSVNFGDLKIKLIASIAAISAIALLRVFLQVSEGRPVQRETIMWLIAMHLTFVVSGVLLATMDWLKATSRKR